MANKTLATIILASSLAVNPVFGQENNNQLEKEVLRQIGLSQEDYKLLTEKEASEVRGSPNSQGYKSKTNELKENSLKYTPELKSYTPKRVSVTYFPGKVGYVINQN